METVAGLSVKGLEYKYPNGKLLSFKDLSCSKGNNLLISGESGSGKTTLLHMLAGILRPLKGEVSFGDVVINRLEKGQTDKFRGRHIGMIFQRNYFLEGLSLMENLKAVSHLSGTTPDVAFLNEMLALLGIKHLAGKKPDELSEGEQQRFSIARAMANKPSWVLADEPTSSLDDRNTAGFIELMKLNYTHTPVSWLIATHDGRLKPHFKDIYQL